MRKILLLLFISVTCISVKAQTETDSVKAVIQQLFTAMRTTDTVLLRSCFDANAIMQTIVTNKEGKTAVQNEEISTFISQVARLPKGSADERIEFEGIHLDGMLANVWTPYRFYFNDQFSHCGADDFTLVKVSGQWKIRYLIDTRRKLDCKP